MKLMRKKLTLKTRFVKVLATLMSLSYLLVVFSGVSTASNEATVPGLPSQSNRVYLQNRGFSIIPPEGWKTKSAQFTSMVFMEPKYKNAVYRASIQMSALVGGHHMDALSARKMATTISEKYARRNTLMEGYKLLNYEPIRLNDGRKGYIYYTEFSIRGTQLMQMLLYTSSASKHFIVTYTDQAKYFSGDFTSQKLQDVWNSFQSIQLDSPAPIYFYENKVTLSIIIGLILLLGIVYFIRRTMMSSRLNKFNSDPSIYNSDIDLVRSNVEFKKYKEPSYNNHIEDTADFSDTSDSFSSYHSYHKKQRRPSHTKDSKKQKGSKKDDDFFSNAG